MSNISIRVELDPIVKLACTASDCKHNLLFDDGPYCNLKRVRLDEDRRCTEYEPRGDGDA